jgi:hypothetical protein
VLACPFHPGTRLSLRLLEVRGSFSLEDPVLQWNTSSASAAAPGLVLQTTASGDAYVVSGRLEVLRFPLALACSKQPCSGGPKLRVL